MLVTWAVLLEAQAAVVEGWAAALGDWVADYGLDYRLDVEVGCSGVVGAQEGNHLGEAVDWSILGMVAVLARAAVLTVMAALEIMKAWAKMRAVVVTVVGRAAGMTAVVKSIWVADGKWLSAGTDCLEGYVLGELLLWVQDEGVEMGRVWGSTWAMAGSDSGLQAH